MAPTRRWLALTAFVALIAGAGGVSAGILITSPPTPASLASSSAPSTVPVTTREFTDTRSLTLTIPPASPHELTSPIAGRITALQAATGTPITSGSIPCEIDGLPLLALALSTPLYQDVVDGATGPDIAALNAELARLGYAAPADSQRVTAATRAAMASAMGVNDGAGGVPTRIEASHVLWIPSPTVTPRRSPFTWVTASIRALFSSLLRTPATLCASPFHRTPIPRTTSSPWETRTTPFPLTASSPTPL